MELNWWIIGGMVLGAIALSAILPWLVFGVLLHPRRSKYYRDKWR